MASRLFQSVCFYILGEYLETDDKEITVQELRNALIQGGAIEEQFVSELVTHIVADLPVKDIQFVKGDDCKAVVIHSKWASISSQCNMLLPTTPFESQECKLFAGVLASPTGLSRSDRDKLHALLLYYGGEFQGWLNEKVSHLIAIQTKSRKYQAALKYNIPIVRPEWILDCIKCNRRLPESDYTVCTTAQALIVETLSVTKSSTMFEGNDSSGTDCVKKRGIQSVSEEDPTLTNGEPLRNESLSKVVTSDCTTSQKDSSTYAYPLLDRVSLKRSETSVSSCVPSEPDTIASTPQPFTISASPINTVSKTSSEHLLNGMVFVITDYPAVLDNCTISKWKDVIRKHGGDVADEYNPRSCTHLLAQNKCSELYRQGCVDSLCIASAHWLNDILSEQMMFPPRTSLHYPIAFKDAPEWCHKLSVTVTNYVGSERELITDMIRIAGIPYTGHLCRSTTHLICKRPEGRKYEKALEWGVNVVNSVFISDIIHNNQMPSTTLERYSKLGDENEFVLSDICFDITKLSKVWQQFIINYSLDNPHLIDKQSCHSCLNSHSPLKSPVMSPEIHQELHTDAKHLKLSESESTVPDKQTDTIVMFTGFEPSKIKKYKSICKLVNLQVTSDPRKCTHLIAPRVARTIKFLCAISVSKYILCSEWLEQCGSQEKIVDEAAYILCDKESEDKFALNISMSLERASERRLLNGVAIHATRNVIPSFENLKLIVECAGGMLYTQSDLYSVYGRKYERLATDGRLLIVISCPDDVSTGICSEFYQRKIPVYNAEFILTGVLRQSLSYNQNQLNRQ